jgi:hypothetical protein
MKLTANLAIPIFDLKAAQRSLDEVYKEILIEGVKEWVMAVEMIVPNWSGESRASLRALASQVDIEISAFPVAGAPDRVSKGEAEGHAEIRTDNFKYSFSWKSQVFHFIYNESNNANAVGFHLIQPGPYHSMMAAESAFTKCTQKRIRALKWKLSTYLKILRRIIR